MRILLTGKNGYISNKLYDALIADGHECEMISLRADDTETGKSGAAENWMSRVSLAGFDVLIHCVGIVHKKASSIDYYRVNTDLTIELGYKAKADGVKHFVFLSTMAVYGAIDGIHGLTVISKETQADPKNDYGRSKFLAEEGLKAISGNGFNVTVLRLPMVYDTDLHALGNMTRLMKQILRFRLPFLPVVFPMIDNKRSMLNITSLSAYIQKLVTGFADAGDIVNNFQINLPQDDEYICTSLLVREIASIHGQHIRLSRVLGALVRACMYIIPLPFLRKMFGSLVYEKD